MKKRLLSLALVLVMMLSFSMVVYAEDVFTLKIGDADATAGTDVVIPVTLLNSDGVAAVNIQVTGLENGISIKDIVVNWDDYNDEHGTDYSYQNGLFASGTFVGNPANGKIGWVRATNVKGTRPLFYLILSVAQDTMNGPHEVSITKIENTSCLMANEKSQHLSPVVEAGIITVTGGTPVETRDYTVSLSQSQTVAVDTQAAVAVSIASETKTSFNAVDMTVEYDSTALQFASISDTTNYTVRETTPGVLRILGYGDSHELGAAFTLNFTAKAVSDGANVTVTGAKVDDSGNAAGNDAAEATLVNATASITVSGYNVTLGEHLTGAAVAAPTTDYTFTAEDYAHYDYVLTATVGGTDISDKLVDNGDGTYTIPAQYVTGAIVVNATRTPKTFTATLTGNGAEDVFMQYWEDTATYGEGWGFSINRDPAYTYEVSITVGGVAYDYAYMQGNYRVRPYDVTGDIVVTVTKTLIPPNEVNVTFEGEGAGDATGAATATYGEDYTFSLAKSAGYEYTLEASRGGEAVSLTDNGDGTYTIAGADVKGDIVVTITKEMTAEVEVYEYVKLDSSSIFLVVAKGELDTGKAYTYDGNTMYWSEKYEAYVYLVITDSAFNATVAAEKLVIADGTAVSITYTGDVNETGTVDINDAQLVYDMYNAKYDSFDVASMTKFLRADMNGDFVLSVQDSAAIIEILFA